MDYPVDEWPAPVGPAATYTYVHTQAILVGVVNYEYVCVCSCLFALANSLLLLVVVDVHRDIYATALVRLFCVPAHYQLPGH